MVSIFLEKLCHFSVKQYIAFRGDFEIIFFSINQKSCNSQRRLQSILGFIWERSFSISLYEIQPSLIDLIMSSTHFFEIKESNTVIGHAHSLRSGGVIRVVLEIISYTLIINTKYSIFFTCIYIDNIYSTVTILYIVF